MNKYIIVVGSKPDSMLPDLKVEEILTANGAAEKAKKYIERYENTKFTAVIGGSEFLKNSQVKKRVINSNPDFLISRSGIIDFKQFNFKKKINFFCYDYKQQLKFQLKYFKYKYLSVLLAELKYGKNFFESLYHLLRAIKYGKVQGVSTGLFCILYSLQQHPDCDVILTGIGMKAGGHFYDNNSQRYSNRSKVDQFLFNNLKKKYRDRIKTIDKDLSKLMNITYLDVGTF